MDIMDPDEFRELGYLQELNRTFLHPLGLALSIKIADGNIPQVQILKSDDPEGVAFSQDIIDDPDTRRKALHVLEEFEKRRDIRDSSNNFISVNGVQTIGD